jgi:hypothetical protein
MPPDRHPSIHESITGFLGDLDSVERPRWQNLERHRFPGAHALFVALRNATVSNAPAPHAEAERRAQSPAGGPAPRPPLKA